jgi:hypothetical protein
MSASIVQLISSNLANSFEQIGVSVRVLERSDGSRHRRRIPLPRNGAKSVDPFELRQLKMQRWATKVDSIGARLGSENEVDGVTSCTSVESSGESEFCLLDSENRTTLDRHDVCTDELATAVAYARSWSSRLEFAQVRAEAMGALGEDKSEVRIVTVDEHGQSAEILKGILRHIEIQRFKKYGLCRERFTSLGKPDQASVRWRIGNIVHAFIVASVLSGLDVVRIDVEVQKVLQGLCVAKKNTCTGVDLGLGGATRARRLDVHTTAERTETRQIRFTTRTNFVRSLHLITVNGHVHRD